jgi:hypothetical protein
MPTLYGALGSSFVRKAIVALTEKGITYDHDPVPPFVPNVEYRKISPLGKIPAYRGGDRTLADSWVIIAYLERTHPEPPLYPRDPYEYARAVVRGVWRWRPSAGAGREGFLPASDRTALLQSGHPTKQPSKRFSTRKCRRCSTISKKKSATSRSWWETGSRSQISASQRFSLTSISREARWTRSDGRSSRHTSSESTSCPASGP